MDENRRSSKPLLQYWAKLKKNVYVLKTHRFTLCIFRCILTIKIVKECSLKNASFHNPVHNIFFLLLPEPIIKPVKNKQFTLMEQELPATVYDME